MRKWKKGKIAIPKKKVFSKPLQELVMSQEQFKVFAELLKRAFKNENPKATKKEINEHYFKD